MDHAGQPQVVVESLAGKDLAGAMLRRSFSRRPNRSLYWPPMQAVFAAFLTAGVWPTGLLIYRLWKYATHQRFRAGELATWLRAPSPPGLQPGGGSPGAHDVHWTQIPPLFGFALAAIFWAFANAVAALLVFCIPVEFLAAPDATARARFLFFAGAACASMMQIATVFGLRERVDSCFKRSDMLFRRTHVILGKPNLPLWSLWPAVLALLSIPAKFAGFQVAAMWIVTATAAVLASEIQRGYISVADRRLRLSVARAIGAAMYSEARR